MRCAVTLTLLALLPLWAASTVRAEAVTPPAAAPERDDGAVIAAARGHFQRGTEYYSEGDYRAALIEFERAYALRHTYRLLYNLAQVAYELRDYAAAERHFRAYLVEGEDEIDPERRREVMLELKRLRERVASLHVRTEPEGATVHIDDRLLGSTPFTDSVRVSAGRRRVVAELAGYAPVSRTIDITGGEELRVALHFGPPLVASDDDSRAEIIPWVTGIASGVFALGAVGFGYSALSDQNEHDSLLKGYTTRGRLEDLAMQARNKAIVADVMLGAAVLGAAVTAVLLMTREEKPPRAAKDAMRPTGF